MGSTIPDGLLQQAMNGGAEGQQALREFLAAHPDPRIRMFAEWAAQQEPQTIDVEAEAAPAEAPERGAGERRLVRRLKRLERELRFQREIGDTLAAALGACYLCWGGDGACEECGGRGEPGWKAPEPELFEAYVAPAVRRAQSLRKASHEKRTREPETSPNEIDNERKPS